MGDIFSQMGTGTGSGGGPSGQDLNKLGQTLVNGMITSQVLKQNGASPGVNKPNNPAFGGLGNLPI